MPSDKRNRNIVPGDVAHIRLDSQDIMSCIDAAELSGMARPGMGLNQAIKWGLVAMAQTLRQSGYLPERTGFEYAMMTEKYKNPSMAVRVKTGITLNGGEVEMKTHERTPVVPTPKSNLPEYDENEWYGLVVPPNVKALVPCGKQDLAVIRKRMHEKDPNVTAQEVAKFLLYTEDRAIVKVMASPAMITAAELLITQVWPEYPSVYQGD